MLRVRHAVGRPPIRAVHRLSEAQACRPAASKAILDSKRVHTDARENSEHYRSHRSWLVARRSAADRALRRRDRPPLDLRFTAPDVAQEWVLASSSASV
jgi:hypothetical protein